MITRQDDGSWVCRVCGKTQAGRQARGNMKQHVETHIEGIQHTCTTCGKTYKNRNSLHTHISMKHRDSLNEVGKKKYLMCTSQINTNTNTSQINTNTNTNQINTNTNQ